MHILLRSRGNSFATRRIGAETAQSAIDSATGTELTLDLTEVYVSPSFVSEFLHVAGEHFTTIRVVGANEHAADVSRKVADRQGLADVVTIEDAMPIS